LRWFYLRAL